VDYQAEDVEGAQERKAQAEKDVSKVSDIFHDIKAGVENIIYWLPVIWKDRWYDWVFLTMILEHKLQQMGKETKVRGCQERSPEKAAQMLVCADLCKRIRDDEYRQYELAQHEKHWGDLNCPICGGFLCDCFPTEGGYHWVALYENVKTKKDDELAGKEMSAIRVLQEKDIEDDIELLFYIIRTKLREWWD